MKYLATALVLGLLSLVVVAGSTKEMPSEEAESIIRKASPYPVSETMDKFETLIKKKGFDVFVRIDHQKNAEGAELTMDPAEVIIFGNPKGGTLLMRQDIRVALDLPLRVVVYKDADEKVYIAYHHPAAMTSAYDLADNKVVAQLIEGLMKLTDATITEQK